MIEEPDVHVFPSNPHNSVQNLAFSFPALVLKPAVQPDYACILFPAFIHLELQIYLTIVAVHLQMAM